MALARYCAAFATLSALSPRIMIRRWFKGRSQPAARFDPVAPETPFLAVGDIHGRADLLNSLLNKAPDFPVVCVGDYVDRGDHSAEVLRILHARPDIICISGNHERMMLQFVQQPEEYGPRWLRYGGLQTLASFGVSGLTEATTGSALSKARNQLVDAMGEDMLSWLNRMPTRWRSGNVAVVHAGADPGLPIEDQSNRTLQWGHPDFHKTARQDGVWVVHGHTIVDQGHVSEGRIAVDTGAYATGRLTVALIGAGEIEFETV